MRSLARQQARSQAQIMREANRYRAPQAAITQVRHQQRAFKKEGLAGPRAARTTAGESFVGKTLGPLPNPRTAGPLDYALSALALVPAEGLAAKGVLTLRAALRGEKGLKTISRLERATKAAEEASHARKAQTAAERVAAGSKRARVAATAKGVGREARAQLGRTENAVRLARAQDRTIRSATNPVAAAALAAPGDIGNRARAFAEGTVTADPRKSLATTARSIPASLGFLADAAAGLGASGVRATQEGLAAAGLPGGHNYSGSEIASPTESVVAQVPDIVSSLAPLVSGDPAAVRNATESQLGYVFAPLLPRGAISGPVRAVGRGVRGVAERAAEVADRTPKGTVRSDVGALREVAQRFGPTGRSTRKRVAKMAAREVAPEHYFAARREHELDKALGRGSRGKPVRDLVGVLADYGIGRDRAPEQLRQVKALIERHGGEGVPEGFSLPTDTVTTSRAIQVAEQHPEVLQSDRLWNAVDAYKQGAKEVETSDVAKYREQGRLLDVQPPESRVPVHARKLTKATTRREAWDDYEGMKKQIGGLRRQALKEEARGAKDRANELRGQAKALSNRSKNLHATLKPYTHPDVTPSPQLKSIGWDASLAHEFLDEVRGKAGRHGFAEPAWTRHADLRHVLDGDIPVRQHGKPTGTQHIKTGAAEIADMVDRSYDSLVKGSIYFPRMRNAVARFTRRFLESEAKVVPIDGAKRTVITRDQANRAYAEGTLDPREDVLIPANQWGNAIKHAAFDLRGFHTEVANRVLHDAADLGEARGTRYVAVSREAAREFADQINPSGGGIEKLLSGAGHVGSVSILGFSPAWAMVQIGAEGLQMLAAVTSPRRLSRAIDALRKGAEHDRKGYEGFVATAGESAGFLQPRSHRVSMGPNTQGLFARAYKTLSRTALGETIFKGATGELLSQFDRFKGGKFRSVVLAAQVDRQLNGFLEGLKGATKVQRQIAEELQGKPLHEQITRLGRDPKLRKLLDAHTNYLDDVMGNFNAYTRYERRFGPLGIFYPYVRMSFRWTLWTYPARHPVKAQMLYLAGQQHANDLEKLLGAPPDWIHYGDPIVYDKNAKKGAVAILPIGQRISPGLNAFMESVGTGNVAGLVRGANPFIGTAFYGLSGINPLSGQQEAKTTTERGLLVLNQLLSMPAPVRALGLNQVGQGPESPVSKKFQQIDPQRQLRSNVFPYLPQSVESAKKYNDLQRLLNQAFGGYQITVPQTDAQKAARSKYEQEFPSGSTSSGSSSSWRSSSSGSSSWRDSSTGSSSWRKEPTGSSSWRSGG
jgi:hypothetical protein